MPRLVLATAAVLFAAFGLAFAIAPRELAPMTDIALPTATAITDYVATYGGSQIGFAAFLCACLARRERTRIGLLAAGWVVAGFAVSRGLAMALLGDVEPVMYGALLFESTCATIAFVAAWQEGRLRAIA